MIYRRTGAQQRGASEAKQDALDMGKQHLDSQRTMALGLRQEAIMSTVMSATEDTPLDRVKRTVLQKFDVADGSYEAVVELLEIGPNVVMDRHSHSGPETGYLLEGDATFEFDEQPALHVKAGQSYVLPADFVHVAKSGSAGAKGIYMWVIEKGRPFRTWAGTRAWQSPPEA